MPLFPDSRNVPGANQPPQQMPLFYGNGFTIFLPPGWEDKTIYTITGPVEKEVQHNIIVVVDKNVVFNSVIEYGESHVCALEGELKGCRILKKGTMKLGNDTPAYRVVLRWQPAENRLVYQEHLYILANKIGYKMTTTFTKKTRKTLGPLVERIMMSFKPERI